MPSPRPCRELGVFARSRICGRSKSVRPIFLSVVIAISALTLFSWTEAANMMPLSRFNSARRRHRWNSFSDSMVEVVGNVEIFLGIKQAKGADRKER